VPAWIAAAVGQIFALICASLCLEVARMFSSMKSFRLVPVIAAIIILFSQMGGFTPCYGSKKTPIAGVDQSGTIVILDKKDGDSCPQGLCIDIYPKDGKIEGKHVSLLNPTGVNSLGQVVGLCVLEDPEKKYAFFREPDGRIWIFRTPSKSGQGEFTDISDSGKAVGFYEKDKASTKVGFLMNSKGQWVMDIQYPSNPCPAARSYLHTEPNGINSADEIVGNYDCTERPDDAADPILQGNGFYRAPDGTFYRVQYENAKRTVAGKISDTGIIFGYYVVDNETWIPFAAEKKDVIQPINR
jgi:hypothetical protein